MRDEGKPFPASQPAKRCACGHAKGIHNGTRHNGKCGYRDCGCRYVILASEPATVAEQSNTEVGIPSLVSARTGLGGTHAPEAGRVA